MASPSVFISYSRKDRPRAVQVEEFLKSRGISAWFDRNLKEGENFHRRIREELKAARRVIVIWTKTSVESEWVNAEATYARDRRTPLIQMRWESCDVSPPFNLDHGINVAKFDDATKDQLLTAIGAVPVAGTRRTNAHTLIDADVELGTIPSTSADILFGRHTEIEALVRHAESEYTRLSIVHALGGEGKTSLLNHWIQSMQARGWGGARRVFGWSFYAHGSEGRAQASADRFFDEALAFFGYDGPPLQLSEAKARELARLIKRERTILILDGLEPLQHMTGSRGAAGRIRDAGLKRLMRDILTIPECFCLITTRVELGDLRDQSQPLIQRLKLPPLPRPAAIEMLRHLGVKGRDVDLEAAVTERGGHALTLSLLGRFLRTVHGGDVRRRADIRGLEELDAATVTGERSVAAIMEHYEYEYSVRRTEVERGAKAQQSSTAARQLAFLRLLGLFDRPTPYEALRAIISARPTTAITETLASATEGELRFALAALADLGLLNLSGDGVDAHPLVRSYFRVRLTRSDLQPSARAAHLIVSNYFKKSAQSSDRASISALEPWIQAIQHSCAAGDIRNAYQMYVGIDRGSEHALTKRFGAHGTNIELISLMLENSKLCRQQLDGKTRGELWGFIATSYQSLGRTPEAEKAYARSYAMSVHNEIRAGRALMAQFQADLAAERGDFKRSVRLANTAVEFGPREIKQPDKLRYWANLMATYGTALEKVGRAKEAETQFKAIETEVSRAKREKDVMRGRIGYKVCSHWLRVHDRIRAERIVNLFHGPARRGASLVSRGLELLCIADFLHSSGDLEPALQAANEALDTIWKGAEYQAIIRGLVLRGAVLADLNRFAESRRDLLEALDLAMQAELYALETDVHLAMAEMSVRASAQSDATAGGNSAAESLGKARALAQQLAYGGIKRRLAAVEAVIKPAA